MTKHESLYRQLNGLGCACNQHLGAVTDYDLIIIGGKQYSARELQVKAPTIIAASATKVYTSAFDTSLVKYVTGAGNTIGKYYSYLLPKANRKDAWIQLQTGANSFVFVKNEALTNSSVADQGLLTAAQEKTKEDEALQKENDPYTYYFKKLVVPVLGAAAAIYIVVQLGKTFIIAKTK